MSTCLRCNKICKNAAGLAIHMRTCKTINALTLPVTLHQCEIEADTVQIKPIYLSNLKDKPIQSSNINISDIEHEIKKYKECLKKIEMQLIESNIIVNSLYKKFSNEKRIIELELHNFKEKSKDTCKKLNEHIKQLHDQKIEDIIASEQQDLEIKRLTEYVAEKNAKIEILNEHIKQLHDQKIEDIIASEQQDLEIKRLTEYVSEKNAKIEILNKHIAENIKKNKEQDLEIKQLHELEIQKLSKYILEKNSEIKALNERIENQSLKTHIRIEKIKHQEEIIETQNYEIKILKEHNIQQLQKILEYKKLKVPISNECSICFEKKQLVSVNCCVNKCCVTCFCKSTNDGIFKCPYCRRETE